MPQSHSAVRPADAALVAACGKWLALYPRHEVSDGEFVTVKFQRKIDRMKTLEASIASTPALTDSGRRAKATVVQHLCGGGDDLALSLARDLI